MSRVTGEPLPQRGRQGRRRWVVVAALCGTVALGLGVGAVASLQTPEPPQLEDPDQEPADLSHRGWVLGNDTAPPSAVDGMRLVETLLLSYAERELALVLDDTVLAGGTRYAVLWCDLPPVDDPGLRLPTLSLELPEGAVVVPCAGRRSEPPVRQLAPLPPAQGRDEGVPIEAVWAGDLPNAGTVELAIYLESLGVPLRRSTLLTAPEPQTGAVVLDPGTTIVPGGARLRSNYVQPARISHDSDLTLWAGGSGLVEVLVDGVVVTDDGDLVAQDDPLVDRQPPRPEDSWRQQDPELRGGAWHVSVAGATRTLELPEELLPPPGQHRTVIVSVPNRAALPSTWQVSLRPATMPELDLDPLQPTLPRDLPGPDPRCSQQVVQVASWTVPQDGLPRQLVLPAHPCPGHVGAAGDPLAGQHLDPGSLTYRSTSIGLLSNGGLLHMLAVRDLEIEPGEPLVPGAWRRPSQIAPPEETGLWVTMPPAPGRPEATLTAYVGGG